MNAGPWVLADWGAVVSVVLFVIFALLSVLGQLASRPREVPKRQRPRPTPPPPRGMPAPPTRPVPTRGAPAPPRGTAAPTRPAEDPLAREIEEFLRRAQAQRAGQPVRSAPPPPPLLPPSPLSQHPRPSGEAAESESSQRPPATVAEHVQSYLGPSRMGEVGSKDLGQAVAKSEDRLEAHLREVFEHQVGTLASAPGEAAREPTPVEPSTPADRITAEAPSPASLAAVLVDPGGVRQAFLLSEILNRPEHRWS